MKEFFVYDFPGYKSMAIESSRIEECLNEMKKRNLTNLSINSAWGWRKGKSLAFLKDNDWITGINLVEDGLDISVLNELHSLKILVLSADIYIGKLDFSNFPNLIQFSGKWNSKNYFHLNSCKHFEDLRIWKYPWKDLTPITEFDRLGRLEINYGQLESLEGIAGMNNLNYLELYSLSKLTSIESLIKAKSFKSLSIKKCKFIESYEGLDNLYALETLFMDESAPIDSVAFIRKLSKLRSAYIGLEIIDKDPSSLKEKGFEFKRSKNYR